jgi:hypothetical protein
LITKGDSTVQYFYNAAGTKIQKKVNRNGVTDKTTDNVGTLVYEGTNDIFLHTEEGRIVLKESGTAKNEYKYLGRTTWAMCGLHLLPLTGSS